MEKPIEPNTDDCCNSGCNPCIFDLYEKQLMLYKKYLLNGEIVNKNVCGYNGISQFKYTEFVVVKNISVCHLHNCIQFKNVSVNGKKVWWKPGDHFLFKYTADKKLSCTRAYTPVKLKEEIDDYDFFIIVKKYDSGLVSTYLCNLKEGDQTIWRGPYGHYELEPNKFNRIIMIAQGTGISPLISIIDKILNNEDDMTKVLLLYCCKCENSILFREELYAFKSYWNFKYEIFLGQCQEPFSKRYQEPIKNHRLNINYLLNFKPFLDNDQIILCGADKFTEAFKNHLELEVPKIENIILF